MVLSLEYQRCGEEEDPRRSFLRELEAESGRMVISGVKQRLDILLELDRTHWTQPTLVEILMLGRQMDKGKGRNN